MTPERHEEIGELFHATLELDPSERNGFLRRACDGDEDLYQQVSSLLKLERTAADFIEDPVWQTYSEPLPAPQDRSNKPGGGPRGPDAKYCPKCQRRYPGRQRMCPEDNQRLSLPDPYRLVDRILADKYRIEALVGIGGMGAVYSAYHLGIDRPVAVKILQPNVAISNDRMVDLFEREAKVVGHLYHENIADIKDAGRASDGIAYIIMEWLDGCTLDEELAASGPFDLDRVAGIFRQISAALEAAHAKQIVHCDLKPSNIMLNPGAAGRELVKVLDFGIAKIMTDPAGSLVSAAMGTPHYASPEQLQIGRTVDARSDIYSLGVILFQMLTGKLPFQAGSVRELINRQMEAPARIAELRPETPVAIQQIVKQMLAIDPAGRPESASAAAAIVDHAMRDRIETPSVQLAPASERQWNATAWNRGPVGRESECAELRASFGSVVSAGAGQLVCVTGEPGIGKTTVVEEFLNQSSANFVETGRGLFIARGRCSERLEGTGAYLPLLEAMEGLIRSQKGPAREEIDRLMGRVAPAWRAQITPHPLAHEVAPSGSEKKAASLEQMKRELKAFFQELSVRQPVVLFIDDLHWSDISTIDLLAFLVSKFDQLRMLIVTTYRPSELLLARSPFVQVMLDFQSRGLRSEIALRFFSRNEIERYLAVEFPGHDFPREFPDFIQEKTEGNPLFMADLVRYLRDREVIHREGGAWTLAEAIPDIGPELPESVRGMIRRKINQLDDGDLRLLTAASVQGQEIDSAVLSKVLDIDSGQVEERLHALDEIHAFVRFVGEHELPDKTLTLRYRFVHGLYQNTLYDSLKHTRRAALSETTAAALLGFYKEKSHSIAADLALLFKAARKFSRASDYFLLAAQNAANVFAYQEAIELSRRGLDALKGSPDSPEQTNQEMRLQINLGMSLIAVKGYASPDVERAFTRARELCLRTEASPQLFPVLRGLSLFYRTRPKLDEARKLGEQMLNLAEGRPEDRPEDQEDKSLHIEALFALSFTLLFLGELADSLEYAERGIDLDNGADQNTPYDHGATIGCLTVAGLALWALGFPDQALGRSRQGVALARRLAQPFYLARSLAYEALLLLLRRDWNDSARAAQEAISISRRYGFSFWLAMATIYHGYALFKQGQREEGIRELREGLEAETASGAEVGRPFFLTLLAEALAATGRIDEGIAMIDDSLALVNNTSERFAHSDICRVKGELLLGSQAERPESPQSEIAAAAEDFFRQAIEIARIRQAKSLELRAVISLSQLLQSQGRKEEARQTLSEIRAWFTEGGDTMDLRKAGALLTETSPL
jgi:serine/threonine protein kinase/tetratricopeptide (TPR) repeat protein